jgi:hypothetical protein
MKQTAVEWLQEALSIHLTFEQQMQFEGLFQQAKEMEKEQRNYFVELSKWIIENKRSVFDNADISIESKRKILNELGYSSGDY